LPEFADAVDGEAEQLLRIAAWLPVIVADAVGGDTGITLRTLLAAFLLGEDPVSLWFQRAALGSEAERLLSRDIYDGERKDLAERVASGALPPLGNGFTLFSPTARSLLRKARWLKRRVTNNPRQDRIGCRHILACYAFLPTTHAFLERKLAREFGSFIFSWLGEIRSEDMEAWKELSVRRLSAEDERLIAAIERNDPLTLLDIGKGAEDRGDQKRAFAAYAAAADLGFADAALPLSQLVEHVSPDTPSAVEAERPTKGTPEDLIANVGNDDPDAPEVTDTLNVKDEAHAFARLAASRALIPPLALGVFGEWGSGKSFFMRLIREHVDRLAEGAQVQEAEGKDSRFHARIVQIRFNAWHFMESNLWASLVDTVFTELDRWITLRSEGSAKAGEFMDRLATARQLTLEAAEGLAQRRREQAEAAARLAAAERDLAAKRANAVLSPEDVGQALVEVLNGELRELDEAGKDALVATGLQRLRGDAQAFKAALDDLARESRRGHVLFAQLVERLGSPGYVFLVILLIAVLPALLTTWLAHLSPVAVQVAGLIGGATVALNRLLAEVRPQLARLTQLKASLDEKLRARLAEEERAKAAAAAEVAEQAAAVEKARAELQAATAAVAAAIEAYSAESGGHRLRRFIRARAADGTYAKHLGLIATIRRDFEQLSRLMLSETPNEEGERAREMYKKQVDALIDRLQAFLTEGERQLLRSSAESIRETDAARDARFDRIILYIDDLDRCPPAKVVDVLQAIQLLLCFRLFVVVVAVDARWVARSLKDVYPDLLAETVIRPGTGEAGTARRHPTKANPSVQVDGNVERAASSQDYLEKIFQIPYWVRRMEPAASSAFIESLARRQATVPNQRLTVGATAESNAPPAPEESVDQSPQNGEATARKEKEMPPPVRAVTALVTADVSRPADRPSPLDPAARAHEERAAAYLEQSEHEVRVMKALAPYVGGTPRRGLRFVNVFRLIKTGLPDAERDGLVGSHGKALGYRALLAQIAIVTGSPRSALAYFDALMGAEGPAADADLAALRKWCEEKLPEEPDKANLLAALAALAALNAAEGVSVGKDLVEELKRQAPRASRYAFTARRH
jgi:hypothetical protein